MMLYSKKLLKLIYFQGVIHKKGDYKGDVFPNAL